MGLISYWVMSRFVPDACAKLQQRQHNWVTGVAAVCMLLTLGLQVGCDSAHSNGGPKVKVTPDPPPPASFAKASSTTGPPARGAYKYPAETSAPAPVPPPVGKGLDVAVQPYIVVDQFGYLPEIQKVAVLIDPINGWNGNDSYKPAEQMEVHKWSDSSTVFKGPVVLWNGGKLDKASGDRGYWFDFTSVKSPGLYYIYDPTNYVRSYPFEIAGNVYRKVLVASTKMFYFNRANFAKQPPYSCVGKRCWSLDVDYMGPQQDGEARSVVEQDNPATARDLRGGWWDAGDTNKYVTFANEAVHSLLTAYTDNPQAFTDNFNIPESGNGLPDLLDELKYELDWLTRMQPADLKGGVLLKVGNINHADPIPDQSRFRRFYYPKPCSSSTIAAAGMFAHAALSFRQQRGYEPYAEELTKRAISAYEHYATHPKSDACDDGTIKSGDADQTIEWQEQNAVVAAIYLFALTGEQRYGDFVSRNHTRLRPFHDDRWSVYEPYQGDALLFYATLPKAEPSTKRSIVEKKRSEAASLDFYKFKPELDLYRAYMREDSYHWGSNRPRATFGSVNYDMIQSGIAAGAERDSFMERAAGMLHSFHGVNPMQLVYLTNMYAFGGEHCADELFHTWFRDEDVMWDNARTSTLGPAPGYVTGGPNAQYCAHQGDEHACTKSPVREQPPGKAYVDTNKGWDPSSAFDKSWELTEPGIYYQAVYVKLVSKFVK